jgi:hypothetical protein
MQYPFITFWLECVATTPFNVVATHSNQKVIKEQNFFMFIGTEFSKLSIKRYKPVSVVW